MKRLLEGKAAIITGASSGIGRESAYLFAEAGCNLIITARREERLKEVKEKCASFGVRCEYVVGDCREEATAKECVSKAISLFGKLDILVNNAGMGKKILLVDSTIEDYREMMDTNVLSSFLFSKYAAKEMLKQGGGKIIFVYSVTGHTGHQDETIYTMTKFAQRGLAQAIDKELSAQGIQTSVICPGGTKTEFQLGYGRTLEKVASSSWESPEEVALGILYAAAASNTVTEIRMK